MNLVVEVTGSLESQQELQREISKFVSDLQSVVKDEIAIRTPYKSGNARRGWQTRQLGSTKVVDNQVPYIGRLEGGYSRQAPNGFVNQGVNAALTKVTTKGKIK